MMDEGERRGMNDGNEHRNARDANATLGYPELSSVLRYVFFSSLRHAMAAFVSVPPLGFPISISVWKSSGVSQWPST